MRQPAYAVVLTWHEQQLNKKLLRVVRGKEAKSKRRKENAIYAQLLKLESSGETPIMNIALILHAQQRIAAVTEGPVAEKARAKL